MFVSLPSLIAGLSMLGSVFAAPALPSAGLEKRNPAGSFTLVGYGLESSGTRVFYGNGTAYLGTASKFKTMDDVTDVTFTISNTVLAATSTSSSVTLSGADLYIRPISGEILPVGFTSDSTPSDATSSKFVFYGSYLSWMNSQNDLISLFYAKETSTSGIWELFWNTDNESTDEYTQVTIKYAST